MSFVAVIAFIVCPSVPLFLTWLALRTAVKNGRHAVDRHTVDKGVGCMTLLVPIPVLAALAHAAWVRPRISHRACSQACESALEGSRVAGFLSIGMLLVVIVILLMALYTIAHVAEDAARAAAERPHDDGSS